MEHSAQILGNPFAMMLNPEAVLRAVESSQKLSGLQSRVCRPLDNPNKKSDQTDSPESQLGNLQGPEGYEGSDLR